MTIAEQVWALDVTKGSYAYLIAEPHGAILIDTGMPGRAGAMLDEIKGLGLSPGDLRTIVLTHHDIDHIGNAKALQEATGAELWAPALDAPYILGERARPGIKRLVATLVRPPRPNLSGLYADGQRFGELRAIHAPGHTPGHSILAYGRVLFIGDLVYIKAGTPRLLPKLGTADAATARASIGLLKSLEFDWLCPAHGEPTRDGPAVRAFLADY